MLGDRSRSDSKGLRLGRRGGGLRIDPAPRYPCPQPCPELGGSDPLQPHLAEQKPAEPSAKALQTAPFKTGGPWQPQGWEVRLLRRSEWLVCRTLPRHWWRRAAEYAALGRFVPNELREP